MYKIESYKYNTSHFYLFVTNINVRTRNASLKAFARCAETFKKEKKKKEEKESRREKFNVLYLYDSILSIIYLFCMIFVSVISKSFFCNF